MSKFEATIEKISHVEHLHLVNFSCEAQSLQMLSLELNPAVQEGKVVTLACRPASIALAKSTKDPEKFSALLSYANQLRTVILSIEKGLLLSSVMLSFGRYELESILSSEAVERLDLAVGDEVTALLKANELSILEVKERR